MMIFVCGKGIGYVRVVFSIQRSQCAHYGTIQANKRVGTRIEGLLLHEMIKHVPTIDIFFIL